MRASRSANEEHPVTLPACLMPLKISTTPTLLQRNRRSCLLCSCGFSPKAWVRKCAFDLQHEEFCVFSRRRAPRRLRSESRYGLGSIRARTLAHRIAAYPRCSYMTSCCGTWSNDLCLLTLLFLILIRILTSVGWAGLGECHSSGQPPARFRRATGSHRAVEFPCEILPTFSRLPQVRHGKHKATNDSPNQP